MELSDIDLNLLRSLKALLDTRSVTGAARLLGVQQPAMSKRLKQLRDALGDPLMARHGAKMRLTARGEALLPLVGDAMDALARVFPSDVLGPGHGGTFTVALGDEVSGVVLGPWMAEVTRFAPEASVRVVPLTRALPSALRSGELDLIVAPDLRGDRDFAMPSLNEFVVRRAVVSTYAVASRLPGPWPMERYLSVGHVLAGPLGESPVGVVDTLLEALGKERHIAAHVPSFTEALRVVEQTDLVTTVPSALARVAYPRLYRCTPPLEVPSEDLVLVWHPRHTRNARHRLFRTTLETALQDLADDPSARS